MGYSLIEGNKPNSNNYECQRVRNVNPENMEILYISNVHYFESNRVIVLGK